MFNIDKLIIIGGPACSGKSFVINKIQTGNCPDLSKQLEISTPSSWLYVSAIDLAALRKSVIQKLIIHYDFSAQYSKENEFKNLTELIKSSNKVTVLTLYVHSKTLIQRNNMRIFWLLLKSPLYLTFYRGRVNVPLRIRQLLKKRKNYKNSHSEILYSEWFKYFSQSKISSHWLLNFNKSDILIAQPYKEDFYKLQAIKKPGSDLL